jgi:hypothetical protein
MYWCIQDLWSPTNLVALSVTELDDALLYLTGVQWDSTWATHRWSSQYHVEGVHYGEVGPGPTL